MKTPRTLRLSILSSLVTLAACGGGGSGDAPADASGAQAPATPAAAAPTPQLSVISYAASSSPGDAALRLQNSKGSTLDYWTQAVSSSTGTQRLPGQVLMTDASGNRVRTVFDANGDISRIVDEGTGRYVALDWSSTGQLIVTEHDATGAFVSGYRVSYDSAGKLAIAPVLGSAGFSGQLTGQLTGPLPGAYALTAGGAGNSGLVLGNAQVLPDSLQAMLAGLPKAAGAKAGIASNRSNVSGPTAHILASNDGDTSGFDLVNAAWQSSLPKQIQQNHGTLLLGFVAGAACAGLVPGCQAVGVAVSAGSLALLMGGYVAQQGSERLINEALTDAKLPTLDDGATSAFDRLRGHIADAWQRGEDLVQTMRDSLQTIDTSGTQALPDMSDLTTDTSQATTRSPAAYTDPAALPTNVAPAPTDTQVNGVLATNNGETYSLQGTVKGDGSLQVAGQQDGGTTQISLNGSLAAGTVTGSYSDTQSRSGTLSGSQSAIGQCQTQQQSGGTGSFSYAYNMGSVGGAVSVSYDMNNIPDRMDVFSLVGGVRTPVFSTGGLVSGTGGTSFNVTPDTTVFVSLSAPNSGTAWDFSLSCPN